MGAVIALTKGRTGHRRDYNKRVAHPVPRIRHQDLRVNGTYRREMEEHARRLADSLAHDLLRLVSAHDRILDMRYDRRLRVRHEGMVHHGDSDGSGIYSFVHRIEIRVEELCEQNDGEEQRVCGAVAGVET